MPDEITRVKLRTPARLHFSLIDLNGELGRIDGGIGVAIDNPNWIITVKKNSTWEIPQHISELIEKLKDKLDLTNNYKIDIESSLPSHVGLGSQTQLSLAVAHGLSILEQQEHSVSKLAAFVGRGGTSGIGVAAFEHGGFILDGGHTCEDKPDFLPSHFSNSKPAVLISRYNVPNDWYFIIAIPDTGKGKYGAAELEIFNKYCPISNQDVEKLSRIILMKMLPAIVEDDIVQFGKGLNDIQKIGFKSIENRLQYDFVKDLQQFFLDSGAVGSGLSSFGPATFCLIQSEKSAKELVEKTQDFFEKNGQTGEIFYTQANNDGVKISTS
jgi:beta-ribofuranosylaminobenzene 5'-phosphate synthase